MARPSFMVVALLVLGLTQAAAVALRLTAPAAEREDDWAPPETGTASLGATGQAAAPAGTPASDADPVRDILDRPVFHPRRRLSSLGEPRTAPHPAEPSGRLVGVLIGAKEREALFAEANNRVTVVRQGGTLQGWKIEMIEPDRVILTSSRGQRTMNLVTDRLQPTLSVPTGPAIVVPPGQTLWRPVPTAGPLDPATAGQPTMRPAGEGR